jgi:hypothetical protein
MQNCENRSWLPRRLKCPRNSYVQPVIEPWNCFPQSFWNSTSVTRCVCEIVAQNVALFQICENCHIACTMEKVVKLFGLLLYVIFKKTTEENSHPTGENSSNLVTLNLQHALSENVLSKDEECCLLKTILCSLRFLAFIPKWCQKLTLYFWGIDEFRWRIRLFAKCRQTEPLARGAKRKITKIGWKFLPTVVIRHEMNFDVRTLGLWLKLKGTCE